MSVNKQSQGYGRANDEEGSVEGNKEDVNNGNRSKSKPESRMIKINLLNKQKQKEIIKQNKQDIRNKVIAVLGGLALAGGVITYNLLPDDDNGNTVDRGRTHVERVEEIPASETDQQRLERMRNEIYNVMNDESGIDDDPPTNHLVEDEENDQERLERMRDEIYDKIDDQESQDQIEKERSENIVPDFIEDTGDYIGENLKSLYNNLEGESGPAMAYFWIGMRILLALGGASFGYGVLNSLLQGLSKIRKGAGGYEVLNDFLERNSIDPTNMKDLRSKFRFIKPGSFKTPIGEFLKRSMETEDKEFFEKMVVVLCANIEETEKGGIAKSVDIPEYGTHEFESYLEDYSNETLESLVERFARVNENMIPDSDVIDKDDVLLGKNVLLSENQKPNFWRKLSDGFNHLNNWGDVKLTGLALPSLSRANGSYTKSLAQAASGVGWWYLGIPLVGALPGLWGVAAAGVGYTFVASYGIKSAASLLRRWDWINDISKVAPPKNQVTGDDGIGKATFLKNLGSMFKSSYLSGYRTLDSIMSVTYFIPGVKYIGKFVGGVGGIMLIAANLGDFNEKNYKGLNLDNEEGKDVDVKSGMLMRKNESGNEVAILDLEGRRIVENYIYSDGKYEGHCWVRPSKPGEKINLDTKKNDVVVALNDKNENSGVSIYPVAKRGKYMNQRNSANKKIHESEVIIPFETSEYKRYNIGDKGHKLIPCLHPERVKGRNKGYLMIDAEGEIQNLPFLKTVFEIEKAESFIVQNQKVNYFIYKDQNEETGAITRHVYFYDCERFVRQLSDPNSRYVKELVGRGVNFDELCVNRNGIMDNPNMLGKVESILSATDFDAELNLSSDGTNFRVVNGVLQIVNDDNTVQNILDIGDRQMEENYLFESKSGKEFRKENRENRFRGDCYVIDKDSPQIDLQAGNESHVVVLKNNNSGADVYRTGTSGQYRFENTPIDKDKYIIVPQSGDTIVKLGETNYTIVQYLDPIDESRHVSLLDKNFNRLKIPTLNDAVSFGKSEKFDYNIDHERKENIDYVQVRKEDGGQYTMVVSGNYFMKEITDSKSETSQFLVTQYGINLNFREENGLVFVSPNEDFIKAVEALKSRRFYSQILTKKLPDSQSALEVINYYSFVDSNGDTKLKFLDEENSEFVKQAKDPKSTLFQTMNENGVTMEFDMDGYVKNGNRILRLFGNFISAINNGDINFNI